MKDRSSRTGATAVEFAIAVTILLTIVFASIEFARLTMLKHAVEHASYVGARRGIIIGATGTEVRDAAQAHLDKFQLNGATVTVIPNNITDETELIEVQTVVPVSGNSWISPVYFGGDLTGRTRMLAERAAATVSGSLAPPPPPPPPPPKKDDDDD
ncbi:MAG: TadE family protein [Planctomycetota bacterium]